MRLKRLEGEIRGRAKQAMGVALRPVGLDLLTRDDTRSYLATHAIDPTPYVHVLRVGHAGVRTLEVLRSGLVRVNRKQILDVDYGNRAGVLGFRSERRHVDRALVLWSHFWTGYYHWTIDVLPKLCLLQDQYGDALDGYALCYPAFGEPYEREAFDLLGIPRDRVIDTRGLRSVVVGQEVAVVPLPGWQQIHPAISRVRQRLLDRGTGSLGPRIYVSRVGRRAVRNEPEVVAALRPYGFEVMEDRPRSVAEQIGFFRSAAVVVAPHGAALSNLLWCTPGTVVVEFFASGYQPTFFRTLCHELGLTYHSLMDPTNGRAKHHWTAVDHAVTVDVEALKDLLDSVVFPAHARGVRP